MDTWLSHSCLRFELGLGVITEGQVTTRPIVEHLNMLEDVLLRFFTGRAMLMVDELALECPEKTFDAGVAPARRQKMVVLYAFLMFRSMVPRQMLGACR